MGIEHNHAVIATTWKPNSFEEVRKWTVDYKDPAFENERDLHHLFAYVDTKVNGKYTIVLTPDGSKEGWPISNDGDKLRAAFITKLKENGDWEWVEVGYGELGTKIYQSSEKT